MYFRMKLTSPRLYFRRVNAPEAIDAMCLVMWFSMKLMPGQPLKRAENFVPVSYIEKMPPS